MKKTLYVIACACISLLALPAAAQVPAYVPTDGLVGWWPFNSNANDESGNGNDGAPSNIDYTTDRFGGSNNALYFELNGGNLDDNPSFITVPGIAIQGDYTCSYWIYHNSIDFGYPIGFGINNQNGNGYGIVSTGFTNEPYTATCGSPAQVYGAGDSEGACYNGFYSQAQYIINSWQHVVLKREGNMVSFYINGAFDNSVDTLIINPIDNLVFGRRSDGWFGFNGTLDDIAIYNRALTEQEIQNLYTGTTPEPCAALPSNLQQGLVGYWPFCGNANDESGNGNDGTVNGATLTEDRFGNAESAYDFTVAGSSIQTIIESNQSPSASTDYTIALWAKRDNPEINNSLLVTYKNGADPFGPNTSNYDIVHNHNFCTNSGIAVQNYPFNNPASCSPTQIENNEWFHLVVHFKTSQFSFDVYKDGNLWFTGNIGELVPDAGILTFGNNSENNFPTQGQLDDIGIWNRALTPEEVQELYTLDACTFTVYDTTYVTVYDTLTTYETVYDTLYTYETIYDTVTTYVTVTDTLLIDITFTGFEGQPSWLNTVTVFPNPASDHITIDYGNFALMVGYNTIITDAAGATVYSSAVNSQQAYIDINGWGAAGVYYLTIYDASGAAVAVRHIVLE
jgi:hypothetical protein